MTFRDLGLLKELIKIIEEKGYDAPTPIQQQAIPHILREEDVMACAQTGTGKTAGFTLPLLQLLASRPKKEGNRPTVRALILAPTRELVVQIGENVRMYSKYLPLKVATIFGGVNSHTQIRELRKGVDIVIATPGRLLDHVGQKTIDLSQVEILVLDEADRMLDMGFIRDIYKILSLTPKNRQNLLFSATFSEEIKALASDFMKSPQVVTVARQNSPAEGVSQRAYSVDNRRKPDLLYSLITSNKWNQVLIFTRTKHGANRLADHLTKDGIPSAVIHGNKSQGARTKALHDFKQGKVRALVATDIASRGIDIDNLPHVVNFELPNVPEDYVHRIGRTGRAGNSGEAISLVCIDELQLFRNIERLLKQKIPLVVEPGYEPDPSIRPQPIFRGRGGQRFGNKPFSPAKKMHRRRSYR